MAEKFERPAHAVKRPRKKVCQFCVDRSEFIDYKDVAKLRKYMTERAKILPRRVTGCCAYHQSAHHSSKESKTDRTHSLHR